MKTPAKKKTGAAMKTPAKKKYVPSITDLVWDYTAGSGERISFGETRTRLEEELSRELTQNEVREALRAHGDCMREIAEALGEF